MTTTPSRVDVSRHTTSLLLALLLSVGCGEDRSPVIYLEGDGVLRHNGLSFALILDDHLLSDGWHIEAEKAASRRGSYSFFVLPPYVGSYETGTSLLDRPLPLQVSASSEPLGPADEATWADGLSTAFQAHISGSAERSDLVPLEIDGLEAVELVLIGTNDGEASREYFYAARVAGARTAIEFRGGMSTSSIPDNTSLPDRDFEQALRRYRVVVASLELDE